MFRELSFFFFSQGNGYQAGRDSPLPRDPGGGISWGHWK